jgi:hypothetical protein
VKPFRTTIDSVHYEDIKEHWPPHAFTVEQFKLVTHIAQRWEKADTDHARMELLVEMRERAQINSEQEMYTLLLSLFLQERRWSARVEKVINIYRTSWEGVGDQRRDERIRLIKRIVEDETLPLSHEQIARICMVHVGIVERIAGGDSDPALDPLQIDDYYKDEELWDDTE